VNGDRFACACIVDIHVNPLERVRYWVGERKARAIRFFLQLGGEYRVTGTVGDRALDFTARGAAETFR